MSGKLKFSILDLSSVLQGGDVRGALDRSLALAQHGEALGYERFWMAEHHGMEGIASAATAVALAHIGQGTKSIRIGAGGIMLPNHAPMVIAEQFGTLEALYPGRVDLGLGRAPGSDQRTAQALRRNLTSDANEFPRDVLELQAFLAGDDRLGIKATPGQGTNIPLYILGSSLFGAQLAAALGLPYAFASHFAPQMLDDALTIYRRDFKPSEQLAEPYVICGFNIFAADSSEEAEFHATSMLQSFVALRTGNPGKLPPPVEGYRESLPPQAQAILEQTLQGSAVGSPDEVKQGIERFIERTGADELIIAGSIFDQAAREKSYAIAADIRDQIAG
ncbi:LLM class flavin-dependent oxidoreductase [Parasphingorhabdus flavimaris]|uniref:LLM class flavin-dependent oxidoreductase n=1 Tax=Parasphingorhabdus flavimaris TaxID=266812 RepID=A0ABX2N5Z7_9SPHN|nr:LLM class flavin-dependent oxidoreductase [Parasphingorhabdus flavimaris]NVD29151.1 LLM class flavin-dependent oxidoreductase [Parasphingorhabdus flavimaris]